MKRKGEKEKKKSKRNRKWQNKIAFTGYLSLWSYSYAPGLL
jgi:hypothetical protein